MGIDGRCWFKTISTRPCSNHPTRKCRLGKQRCIHQFLTPLNTTKTGEDVTTLRNIEARIQANFKNGLPPHLQSNAKDLDFVPGSDQSRIYVTSHSEFSSLRDRDVQKILRERLILVHGNPIDYDYGWDLESFGRIYDVDKKTNVHGKFDVSFFKWRFS